MFEEKRAAIKVRIRNEKFWGRKIETEWEILSENLFGIGGPELDRNAIIKLSLTHRSLIKFKRKKGFFIFCWLL